MNKFLYLMLFACFNFSLISNEADNLNFLNALGKYEADEDSEFEAKCGCRHKGKTEQKMILTMGLLLSKAPFAMANISEQTITIPLTSRPDAILHVPLLLEKLSGNGVSLVEDEKGFTTILQFNHYGLKSIDCFFD